MRYIVSSGTRRVRVDLHDNAASTGEPLPVLLDEHSYSIDWQILSASPGGGRYSLLLNGRSYDVTVRREEGALLVELGGRLYRFVVQDERTAALSSLARGERSGGEVAIKAPMPGLVSAVLVKAGDQVSSGHVLVVLEAMKMENDLAAPRDGVVKEVRVARGQPVNQGEVLVIIGDSQVTETMGTGRES